MKGQGRGLDPDRLLSMHLLGLATGQGRKSLKVKVTTLTSAVGALNRANKHLLGLAKDRSPVLS